MRRLILTIMSAAFHLLLGGGFFAAATFFFRDEAYSIAGILSLAGVVCIALGIGIVKENFGE